MVDIKTYILWKCNFVLYFYLVGYIARIRFAKFSNQEIMHDAIDAVVPSITSGGGPSSHHQPRFI